MKTVKYLSLFIATGLFSAACSQNQPTQVASNAPANNPVVADATMDEFVADDFDLQRVGNLLERSKSPAEFEAYLNEDDGINNLDLNGDGYGDYISVDEYGYDGPNERGLSLYARFGDDRQEIGNIVFYRDEPRYPGARVLIYGSDNIYGDNYYYETNWLEKSITIASFLFSPRTTYYRSPYYYNHYPSGYVVYDVVDTPIYRTRIVDLWPQPVFVFNSSPAWISRIKIKSPDNGLHLGQIYGKLKKPTKEQIEFARLNPGKPDRGPKDDKGGDRGDKGDRGQGRDDAPGRDDKGKPDRGPDGDKGKPAKADKPNDNPSMKRNDGPSMKGPDNGKGGDKGGKPDQSGKSKGKKP